MFNHAPSSHNCYAIYGRADKYALTSACIKINGKEIWVPARSHGMFSIKERLRLAWKVFTGRADVLEWPGQ